MGGALGAGRAAHLISRYSASTARFADDGVLLVVTFDVLSDDGSLGLTIIAFIGNVFLALLRLGRAARARGSAVRRTRTTSRR